MVSKFKPKFYKDFLLIKNDAELVSAFDTVLKNIEKAKHISEINNLVKLREYESRYRIKVKLDKKRDYRIGVYIHGSTVWFVRFLHRNKIYEENW